MASDFTINYSNDDKFNRDVDAISEAWNFEGALLLDPTLTKKKFIEKRLKEQLQQISKQSRLAKAQAAVSVED